MSLQAMRAVAALPADATTPPGRAVLYALAWHADGEGRNAWPSVDTLARHTSLDRRSVQRALAQLRAAGLIAIAEPSLGRLPTRYSLSLHNHGTASPRQPDAGDTPPRLNGGTPSPLAGSTASHATFNRVTDAPQPRQPDAQSFRIPSETEEKSAGARTRDAAPAADPNGNGGNHGTQSPLPPLLRRPVMTAAEREAEIARRRRQAEALAAGLPPATKA